MATLVTRALGAEAESALIAREVDLVYGTRFKQQAAIVEEPLQRENMRVLLRSGHPALGRRLTRKAYAALEHVLVTPRGAPGGSVDAALAPFGLERRVVLRLPNFLSAALIVAQTDFVVTLPQGFAQRMTEIAKLVSLPAPVPIADFTFKMAYSRTLEADPAHRWFRTLFAEAVRDSTRGPGSKILDVGP
jgi:DNA-binding transcriptional LysR family regulator